MANLNDTYCQRNSRYLQSPLGKGVGGSTIYYYGCYFVSLCRQLGVDPILFNQALVDRGCWNNDNYIIVDQLAKKFPEVFAGFAQQDSFTLDEYQAWCIDANIIAVCKVDARGIGGTGTHFVGEEKRDGVNALIWDPWYGDIIKVASRYNSYGNILSMRIFNLAQGWREAVKPYLSNTPQGAPMTMYTMKSGKQVDLANLDSDKVLANVYDEVINQGIYVKKVDVQAQIDSAVTSKTESLQKELNERPTITVTKEVPVEHIVEKTVEVVKEVPKEVIVTKEVPVPVKVPAGDFGALQLLTFVFQAITQGRW